MTYFLKSVRYNNILERWKRAFKATEHKIKILQAGFD